MTIGLVAGTEQTARVKHAIFVGRTELLCRACGYGVVVAASPARCPMCSGSSWRIVGEVPRMQARL
jgi:rubrerythrin